jgi:CHAT domain-containing protein/Tfp pilus assembly protein PilF
MIYNNKGIKLAFIGILLWITTVLPGFCQHKAKIDTLVAFQALQAGHHYVRAAQYDSAITRYQQAADGYMAYTLSLPEQKKWAAAKKGGWGQHLVALYSLASCYSVKGQHELALQLLHNAEALCSRSRVIGDSSLIHANILRHTGGIYYSQGRYEKACHHYLRAIQIKTHVLGEHHLEVAFLYNNIGIALNDQGLYDEALSYHAKALAIRKPNIQIEPLLVAASYNNIGAVYLTVCQYQKALELFQQSLMLRQKALGDTHHLVGASLNNIGMLYDRQGQHEQALAYHQQALAIRKRVFGPTHSAVAHSYNNIANSLLDEHRNSEAITYYELALSILQQNLGRQHPDVAAGYNNIANAYQKIGQYSKALEYYQNALSIRELALGKEHPDVAMSNFGIGVLLNHQGEYWLANQYLQQALENLKHTFGDQHPTVASCQTSLGMNYMAQKQPIAAIAYFQQALQGFMPYLNQQLDPSLFTNSPEVLNHTLPKMAMALQQRNSPGDDTRALATVRLADKLIDSLRRAYTFENDKLQLGEDANRLYQIAIDVAKWNNKDEEALYFSEKSKAMVLAQSLNEAAALQLGGIPDSLLAKDKELRTLVASYTKASIDEELKCPKCDSSKLQNIKNGLFTYQQQQSALQARMESEFPQYFALKYKETKISVQAIQQGFLSDNPNTAILEYLLGDSVLYAFCIIRDSYHFHRQRLDTTRFKNTNALQLEIKKLNRALSDARLYLDPTSVIAQPASLLYHYLIAPFEQHIKGKDLVIIPDGELFKIPFEVLVKPSSNLESITKWQELPYLLLKHPINYHYSAHLLVEDWQKHQRQPTQSSGLLAFAPLFEQTNADFQCDKWLDAAVYASQPIAQQPPQLKAFIGNLSTCAPLPGTEREVKAIYELFSQQNQPAKYYLNDQANESMVKSMNLKPYKYLHFATHGLVDENRPTQSCLILAQNPTPNPSPNGEENPTPNPSPNGEGSSTPNFDNLLTSSEMYGLELDAELVVLSACQTGKGTLKAGEGIIGLTRGLLYAGARNLLVSQWNVNDASTAELMTKFYSKVLAGQSNRQALREAKLELLNSKFACPHYWSAFVLVGR